MARDLRLSMELDASLDRNEQSLIERTLAWLRPRRPHDSALLWNHVKRVAMLGEVLDQVPSLSVPADATFGELDGHEAGLADRLAHADPMDRDLPLPEKAHLARAFLLGKIDLLRDLQGALAPAAGGDATLHAELHAEFAQSVYTLIAIEILLGLLTDPELPEGQRRRAARQLILIWDRAAQVEIDDFCPLLESAWKARSRIGVYFGALVGAGEYMRLVASDCPAEFLDFFVRDDAGDDEVQAFEEFLFNVPFEDLARLRAASRERAQPIDRPAAEAILGRSLDEVAAIDDPDAIFRSYSRRRTASEFRRWTAAPGPRRTAEAYIMAKLLASIDAFRTSEFRAFKL